MAGRAIVLHVHVPLFYIYAKLMNKHSIPLPHVYVHTL